MGLGMPMFVVYPAEPGVLKRILDLLGEPSDVRVEVSVRDERLREVFNSDDVESLTVVCHCKPTVERTLELYRKYYERYAGRARASMGVEEEEKALLSFEARWYVDGLSAGFDGFKLRLGARGNLDRAIEVLKLLEGRSASIEIDLSSQKP